ncbi:hypothetical protein [Pseudomonas putida]|uniref:hypothetical protein n=1 Tax=Pseudomonas putida TaxID=303 RepID=UPI00062A1EF3|nr:hypothetical protein [Pseudomonas putida]
MTVDSFIKGMQRTNANRKQRQAKQYTNTATGKPVVVAPSPAVVASPGFDLEAFRLEIIQQAIAKIMINKQKEMNK